jgi:uncharacterized protein (TIGR02145 family)
MLNGIRTVLLIMGEWGRMLSLFVTATALALGLCGCTDVPEYPDNCKGEYFFDVPCVYYTLTVSRNPASGGTTNTSGLYDVAAGTQVDISATATTGYTFTNWTISGSGTIANSSSASTLVTVNGDVTVTANFQQFATPWDTIRFTDGRDNKSYKAVKIGSQMWMVENLNYEPSSGNSWCYHDNDSYCTQYGRLYDWSTANNVCPSGWHLPSNAEWTTLVNYAGGSSTAGKKLKATSGWNSSCASWGTCGTDNYGFSALQGGYRYYSSSGGTGYGLDDGRWWTATENSGGDAYYRSMDYGHDNVYEGYNIHKYSGFSVRCLQDTATYTYTLTVSKNPTSGGTTNISGQSNITAGTQVDISATAADGYTFSNWTITGSGTLGDANSASTYVTVNGDVTVTANFTQNPATTYTLTVSKNPTSGGTTNISSQSDVTAGQQVNISATAADGYTFSNWTISGSGTIENASNAYTYVTVNGDVTVTANFTQNPATYTLTVNRNPTAGGTTNISGQSNVVAGTVDISATAAGDYSFSNWTISGSGTLGDESNSSTYVEVYGDVMVTANFEQSVMVTPTPWDTIRFTDGRDNNSYKAVKIGSQTWMAENLNYVSSSGSWCYNNKDSYCTQYGRLYDWSTAMAINTSYNSSYWNGSDVKHQGICPIGWHLPSRSEWTTLVTYAGGSSTAGTKLKAKDGWNNNGNGTNDYGFSALPGGGVYGAYFEYAGNYGNWWTATESEYGAAYPRGINYDYDGVYENNDDKSYGYSVRCLQD